MYKNYTKELGIPLPIHRYIAKFFLIMRLTILFMILTLVQVSAATFAQKISLSKTNAPLKSVLKEIKTQSGYNFIITESGLKESKPVSIHVKDADLKDALDKIFNDQNLTYSINKNTITVTEKEIASSDHIKAAFSAIDVSGKVTDEQGQPLSGATVKTKDSKNATTTDAKGTFTLKQVDPGATLQISFIGFQPLEIKAAENLGTIQLKVADSKLDEVQVIAYGITSQRLSTGNITKINAKDIEMQPVNNPLLALQGRVPGLFIQQSTGLPGTAVRVQLQGQNSILNGNDPLYVIDGVPYNSQSLPNLGAILKPNVPASVTGNNPLGFINPSDIESISVLKDADATSIYGSRAANGAILITTKKGKAGDTRVSVNIQNGWGKVGRKLDVLNREEYLQMRHEALKNDGKTISSTDYDLNGTWDTTRTTDWQKKLIGNTAAYFDAQASISGGNENTQYLIGSGFHRETTVFPGNFSDQKGSVHFNIKNASRNQKFKIQLSGSYLLDNNHLPNQDLTWYAVQLAPIAPKLYNDDGTLNWQLDPNGIHGWENPLRYTFDKYNNKTSNLISNGSLSYAIISGLDISTSLGYTNTQSNDNDLTSMNFYFPEDRPYETPIGVYGAYNTNSWIIEPQINFKRTLGAGRLEALLGSTFQQTSSNGQQLLGLGYANDLLLEDIKSASNVTVRSTLDRKYKYNALFGRLNYNLFDKYILNLTARRDGSSRFGPENRFHNFYSVAGAWIFSEESFVKNNLKLLSFGKLRASYGTTGSDQITDYRYLNLYGTVNPDVPYLGGNGLEPTGLFNPYLQWEETRKLLIGLDLGFFNDRVLLNANYVRNRSSNQLLDYPLPSTTGFSSIARNLPATVENSSWEVSLNTINIKLPNFTWSSGFNLTIPKNKLLEFKNIEQTAYATSFIVGQPVTFVQLYKFLGVDKTSGTYIFEDAKGNPTSNPTLDDRIVRVNTSPKYYGGFQNSFTYQRFSLTFLVQFVKQFAQNNQFSFSGLPGTRNGSLGNQPISVLERWQKPGDETTIQRYNSNFALFGPFNTANGSDKAFADASYIRLKNLSLSYQLGDILSQKLHVTNLRMYLQGQNLLTFTKYKGLDPESKSSLTLPPLRVITIGLNATF